MTRDLEYSAKTDDNGYFSITETIDPGPLEEFLLGQSDRTVSLSVKLIEPDSIEVYGTIDIDAEDGSPSNAKKEFRVRSNEEKSLGSWDISMRANIVVVHGRTQPRVSSDTVKFKVKVEI